MSGIEEDGKVGNAAVRLQRTNQTEVKKRSAGKRFGKTYTPEIISQFALPCRQQASACMHALALNTEKHAIDALVQ
ncbi:hypothetical protein [Noviherbaspirillum malthae]|uniref:hypothetical protein n=1 Tax=Noviherbaspirillum malthae TaxID=1260987 RepID=UPI00188E9CC5|nr:hypothetical protein [Noviherbaspirillum malthae]